MRIPAEVLGFLQHRREGTTLLPGLGTHGQVEEGTVQAT